MSQWYFIDGQALGPENFGFTDPPQNTWRPKKYNHRKDCTQSVLLLVMHQITPSGSGTIGNALMVLGKVGTDDNSFTLTIQEVNNSSGHC